MTVADGLARAREVASTLRMDDPVFREQTEYEVYRLLREHLPAAAMPQEPVYGKYIFTRYEDCKFILQHPEVFSSFALDNGGLRYIPQQIDPPEQREYRKILEPMFSPQEMAELEPDIEAFAYELVDKLVAMGEFDFIKEFAIPFPTIIFCRLMGFPIEDHPKLMRWAHIILHYTSTNIAAEEGIATEATGRPSFELAREARMTAMQEAVAYITELLDARRGERRNDILSKVLAAKYAGQRPLTQDELVNMCFLFFIAGLDTVTGALGLHIQALAERPEDRKRFIAVMHDPQGLTLAVEELMRFNSTVNVPRKAVSACPVAGLTISEGEGVLAALISANRDETVFERPDELIFDRHPNPHLGFAVGIHRCLGIHLARRELRIGLRALHERMPNYMIQPGQQPRLYTGGLRGLISLPLVVTA